MLDRIALLLESRPFDWCINCALASIPKANMTKKLFAKNFVSWARLCPEVLQNNMVYELSEVEPTVVRITFKEKIFEEWDDPVIEKVSDVETTTTTKNQGPPPKMSNKFSSLI